MSEVPSRELRNRTRQVLDRVAAGEEVTITASGRPIAVIKPLARTTQWVRRSDFLRALRSRQADPALTQELAELAADTTGDVGLAERGLLDTYKTTPGSPPPRSRTAYRS